MDRLLFASSIVMRDEPNQLGSRMKNELMNSFRRQYILLCGSLAFYWVSNKQVVKSFGEGAVQVLDSMTFSSVEVGSTP